MGAIKQLDICVMGQRWQSNVSIYCFLQMLHSIVLNNYSSRPATSWNFTEEIEKYKYKCLDMI